MAGHDPIRIPAAFWDEPAVRQALRARDMGRLFAALTRWPYQFSQTRIGTAVGKGQSEISRYINRRHRVKETAVFQTIADGLQMPDSARATLGLTSQPSRSLADTANVGDEPPAGVGLEYPTAPNGSAIEMPRLLRVDLDGVPAIIDATIVPDAWRNASLSWLLADTDQLTSAARDALTPTSPVAAIRTTTDMFARLDNQFGGGHARRAFIQYLSSDVFPALQEIRSDAQRREMFGVTAEATLLAAWMSYDAGQHSLAQRYFIQALAIADNAGDRILAGSILDAMSHQATFTGDYAEAAKLAQAAQAGTRGRATATLTAHFSMMEARALARLGDAAACDRAISKAVTAFEKRKPETDPEWISYYDDAEQAAEIGHCFRDLGRPQAAAPHLTQSVGGTGDEYLRSNYFATMVLADTYLAAGDRDQAQTTALTAIRIGEHLKSKRTVEYLREFRTRLADASGSTDAAFIEEARAYKLWQGAAPEPSKGSSSAGSRRS